MLKIGMVGMGGISQAHRAAWKMVPEAQVTCVCDIRREKADDAAEFTGGKAYYDFDEMLDSEQFDILDICLPTYLHPAFAIQALNRGIHVLTEKPISLNDADIDPVYEAARRNNRNFMVAQCVRFWREFELVKEAYETGKYGKLLSGRMMRLGNTPSASWDNWMKDPERSGLVPFDLHIHDLDFIVYAFGAPKDVVCHRARNARQDYISAIYEFDNFFIAAEAAWYDCPYRFQSGFRFQFEKGVMEYRDGKLTIFPQDGEAYVDEEKVPENAQLDAYIPQSNAYYNEIRYFVDCVLAGKPCDKVKPEELHTVLQLIDRLNQA